MKGFVIIETLISCVLSLVLSFMFITVLLNVLSHYRAQQKAIEHIEQIRLVGFLLREQSKVSEALEWLPGQACIRFLPAKTKVCFQKKRKGLFFQSEFAVPQEWIKGLALFHCKQQTVCLQCGYQLRERLAHEETLVLCPGIKKEKALVNDSHKK